MLIKIIDERAVAVEQFVQVLLLIPADAGVEHELGVAAADVDGVELHAARLPDIGQRARLAAKDMAAEQPVFAQHKAPRLAIGQLDHAKASFSAQYTAGTVTAYRRNFPDHER